MTTATQLYKPRTETTEYGYRLAHAFERDVIAGFSRSIDASEALNAVLTAQKGAEGVVVRRDSKDEPWRPLGPLPWWW